jgi:endonuclease YncB( thermonuclease family)
MRGLVTMAVMTALTGCAQEAATAVQSAAPTLHEPAPLTEFYSVGNARDGDDIEFSVRMQGFDTPERGKTCGEVDVWRGARDALDAIINERGDGEIVRHRRVDCVVMGHDQQDERLTAQCSVDGLDIGEQMVSQGWARDWPRYSRGRYADAEARAREARRGIWALDCPADVWSNRDYSP